MNKIINDLFGAQKITVFAAKQLLARWQLNVFVIAREGMTNRAAVCLCHMLPGCGVRAGTWGHCRKTHQYFRILEGLWETVGTSFLWRIFQRRAIRGKLKEMIKVLQNPKLPAQILSVKATGQSLYIRDLCIFARGTIVLNPNWEQNCGWHCSQGFPMLVIPKTMPSPFQKHANLFKRHQMGKGTKAQVLLWCGTLPLVFHRLQPKNKEKQWTIASPGSKFQSPSAKIFKRSQLHFLSTSVISELSDSAYCRVGRGYIVTPYKIQKQAWLWGTIVWSRVL